LGDEIAAEGDQSPSYLAATEPSPSAAPAAESGDLISLPAVPNAAASHPFVVATPATASPAAAVPAQTVKM
jgi:hypothetical protein